tara:strand:+ start:201 stop:1169 length:969 start_codon:yes stop_codon:yes gene_type:complete
MSSIAEVQAKLTEARNELGRLIVGQEDVLDALFISILTRGHALLVGVPGLAKTLIVHTLAKVLGGQFNRVQFTPDLMPSDITGVDLIQEYPDTGIKEFRFVKGPIFCNILLADEINRTPPKTQSALLQAMQEQRISQGDKTYDLPQPFFVLATQNPIEQEGTYPLPEAQLDRFTFSLYMKYPSFDDEVRIALLEQTFEKDMKQCMTMEDLAEAQRMVESIPVGEEIVKYAVRMNFATRSNSDYATDMVKKYISWGSGPRASQFMVAAARARAFMQGRPNVSTDDIAMVAPMVLQHRLVMNFQGEAEGILVRQIIEDLVNKCR